MTLRTRVTLAAGLAVLLAVVAVSIVVYVVVRDSLYEQVDGSLSHQSGINHDLPDGASTVPQDLPLAHEVFRQVVDRDGHILTRWGERALPVTAEVVAVARGEQPEALFTTEVDGTAIRVRATPAAPGVALQVGRSLTEVEQTLRQLVIALIVISAAAVGLAAVIGRLVAAAGVAPVHRVAEAADAVARTGDLSHHIAVPGGDDLGRLAASFNTMLDALSESLSRQRQLVADASHELRTPLATVRTNVEVLARGNELAPEDRAPLIDDTVAQLEQLTRLVGDLVELARGDGQEEPSTLVELDELTRSVVEAARRHHPSVNFQVDSAKTVVWGAPGRVSRAVANLVDNAAKWSPPGATVEVMVRDGTVTVRDHGPGIDAADLPHIFDRFYRSPKARAMPGSGLGLAIVKQVANGHGGSVNVSAAPGAGARFALKLPTKKSHAVLKAGSPATHRDG
jgi:two-component system sensor histidine kinase MprB